MNANTSTTVGSGINESVKGTNAKAKWKLKVKNGSQVLVDNVHIGGNADFDISYLTTED